jgi:hypothetical protein
VKETYLNVHKFLFCFSSMLLKKRRMNWESDIKKLQADIKMQREQNKLRMRQVRALENEEAAHRRREKNKLRMRQVRALENEMEAERRKEKNKLRMRQVRAIEKIVSERNMDYKSHVSLVCKTEMATDERCNEDDSETMQVKEDIPDDSGNGKDNVNQSYL